MTLKVKSHIYRYTGIFLAQKEQDAYLATQEITTENGRSLLTGMWQAKNGFARPMVTWHWMVRFSHPRIYPVAKFLASIHAGLRCLRWDLSDVFRKMKKRLK